MEDYCNKVKKFLDKNKFIILLLIMLLIIIISIPFILEKEVFENKRPSVINNNDWANFLGSYIGGAVGGIATMIAVYKTINHDNSQRETSEKKILSEKEENKKEKLNKLKMILKYEVEMFAEHCESIVLVFINSLIAQWGEKEIDTVEIQYSDFYELTSDFKEFTYELLMILDQEDSHKIKKLLDFYNSFINAKKDTESSKNQEDIPRILSNAVLSKEIKDLLNYITIEQMWIKVHKESNKEYNGRIYTEKELEDKINKLYEEFESGIIHYNKDIKDIIKFLEA